MRIVSLLPSATEIACLVGAHDDLVGRSHECDFPPTLADVPVLTGQRTAATTSADIDRQVRDALQDRDGDETADRSLYTLDVDLLRDLEPDVILTQDLCEVCSIDLNTVRGVAASMPTPPEIISLNPATLEDVFDDVLRVAAALGRETAGEQAMVDLRGRYWTTRDYVNPYIPGPEVAFLEWMDPLFIGGHWTPQLIDAAGGRHSLNGAGAKSKQIAPEDLIEVMPDRLIICPCGYDLDAIRRELPAMTKQPWWPMLPAVMDGAVHLVDGNQMFNRPGPRLIDAFQWLVSVINDRPEVAPESFPAVRVGA